MRGIVWDGALTWSTTSRCATPRPHEVKVRIHNAGLCHSDVSVIDGTIPFPTPVVLGHEGAGVVEEVGDAVRKVKVGDHVVLTTLGNCGQCAACDRGQPTHCRETMGRLPRPFTWRASRHSSSPTPACSPSRRSSTRPRPWSSRRRAAGVGLPHRLRGGHRHRRGAQPGQGPTRARSCVVIGVGGIGQSVIQGARIAAAGRIVVIDANPAKEAVARTFGATDFIDPSTDRRHRRGRQGDLPTGVDHVFECVGHPALIRSAIDMLDWGGTCVLLGVPKLGTEATFVVNTLYNDKSILGCRYGIDPPAPRHPAARRSSTATAACCSTRW